MDAFQLSALDSVRSMGFLEAASLCGFEEVETGWVLGFVFSPELN